MKFLLIYLDPALGHLIIFNTVLNNLLRCNHEIEVWHIPNHKKYFNTYFPQVTFKEIGLSLDFLYRTIAFPVITRGFDKIIYISHFFGTPRYRKISGFLNYWNKKVFVNDAFIEEEHRPVYGYNVILKGNYFVEQYLQGVPEDSANYDTSINKALIGPRPIPESYITFIPFTSATMKDYHIEKQVVLMDYLIEKYGVTIVIPVPLLTDFYYRYRKAFSAFRIVEHNHSTGNYGRIHELSRFKENIKFVQTADTADLIQCVRYSRFQFSMDSGPWHVVNSLDVPSIAMFNNYDPAWHYEHADSKYENNARQKMIYPELFECAKLNDIPPEKIIPILEKFNSRHGVF